MHSAAELFLGRLNCIICLTKNEDAETKQVTNVADYKFDGKELRDRSGHKIAVLDGKYIRDASGSKVGEIDGKYFRNGSGSKVGEFDGRDLRDASGSKIATVDDVRKAIDGIGGATLVAMWLLFVR